MLRYRVGQLYVLPAVLAAFHKRYPEIKVSLLNGNSVEIENLLLERKVRHS
ncbi:MAG: LysR substrate-binding domain-containing protein [Bacteroidales bacterium]|nr:LysR substrate-binding domain-containing protein [Bacteroidales bacterium]